ncbi:Peptidase, M23/M37 family [Chitinispirillum alkaliphilum]|nr:Peptidase, M23/M37 family [Chitinispirillum alkaliphilum]
MYGQNSEGESVIARFDQEITQKSDALDSIRVALEKGRKRLSELQEQEGNYLSRLEQLEQNIAASNLFLDLVTDQIDSVSLVIGELKSDLYRSESELALNQELMKRRLRQAYMRGDYNMLQVLLSARSPLDMIHRVRYLQELNRYDQRLAQSIRETIEDIAAKRTQQEKKKNELNELYESRKEEQSELLTEVENRSSVLEEIRNEQSAYEAMVKELEEAQRELDGIIDQLEVDRQKVREELERKAVVHFENLKGKLPWPVRGRVIAEFGQITHPVYKTVTMNNGIDIEASGGDEVKSVAFGSVAYVGWMRGLGRLVIVEHQGGFVTIYAHLGEINVVQDEMVNQGTVLGKVGDTGALEGSKLHFSIRKSTETFDPMDWLSK